MGEVVLMCYGYGVRVYPSYRVGRHGAERHIRTCPYGPMPWARRIRWHRIQVVKADRMRTHYSVAAARGEWLNHGLMCPGIPLKIRGGLDPRVTE